MTRRRALFITICFVSYVAVLGLWSALKPDRALSDFENRVLAQFPSFTLEKLWNGKYTEQLENYVVDQFINRDMWVGIKADLERWSGKQENNQVFFGKKGYLFERFTASNDMLQKNIEHIRRFAERQREQVNHLSLLLVPNAQTLYPDYLPRYASSTEQAQGPMLKDIMGELEGSLTPISPIEQLEAYKEQQDIYFHTDHHWTMRGAYYGYTAYARAVGLVPTPIEQLNSQLLSEEFYGTYYTKANNRHASPDKLELLEPSLPPYTVCIEGEAACSNSFYHLEALKERDQYKIFFNGNFPVVNIHVEHSEKDKHRSIVVFKDSYANAFIPFLAQHYTDIQMIDLRYFQLNMDRYLAEHKVDDILLLYSVTTVAKDDIFKWLN